MEVLEMDGKDADYETIDEYIALFPENVRVLLSQMRDTIKAAAPEATERISYRMPTFFLNGNLVHFAAFKSHIGFYPTPHGIEGFAEELSAFKNSKGGVQFPFDRPLPLDLVRRMVEFRVARNLGKAKTKK
jgi:uncharacterized protein YdhG (YjbR/CyaY superfamily)